MKVTILTEGGSNIGFGHITRCIALYQAFNKKGFAVNMLINGDDSVKPLLKGLRYNLCDWLKKAAGLEKYIPKADIAVIDSYLAPKRIYEFVSKKIKTVVYIDDFKRISYPKGIVVNGAIGAEKIKYPARKGVKYLLGTKFTPLRKEFWLAPKKKIGKHIKNVLISFGGTDTAGLACKLEDYLKERYDFDITVINAKNRLSASKIKKEMLKTDLCISACGQTTYELARCGAPTIGIGFADNQRTNIKGWKAAGFMEFAGWKTNGKLFKNIIDTINGLDFEKRKILSIAGSKQVDGRGGDRVIKNIYN